MVAIIDEGTRSGMEIFAHALKSNGVKLIGAPTAGDVVAGRGYVLPDDSLLILAVADVYVDGTRLEGVGVTPDVAVPFDVRYAAGRDPQRDAAIEEMVEQPRRRGGGRCSSLRTLPSRRRNWADIVYSRSLASRLRARRG